MGTSPHSYKPKSNGMIDTDMNRSILWVQYETSSLLRPAIPPGNSLLFPVSVDRPGTVDNSLC